MPLGEEVAIRRGRHWGKRSRSGEGRDREIAPTGEVLGERGRHQEKPLGEEGEGRDQEIAPTGEVLGERGRHQEKPLGEGKVAIGRRSRSGDRSYRGGVRRRRGRDREIAPTAFSDNYELKKQSGGVSPTALSVSSHRFIPETSLLLAGRFQFAPSRCCFTSGTDVPFETVRPCQGLAISV